jgi:pentatricopeptide repeat domain-containing protein 1
MREELVRRAFLLIDEEIPKYGLRADLVTVNTLLGLLMSTNKYNESLTILSDMPSKYGLKPDVITYSTCITTCNRARQWDHVAHLHESMTASGIAANIITYNALISAAARQGHVDNCSLIGLLVGLFCSLPGLFCSLPGLFCSVGHVDKAFELWDGLKKAGLEPNVVTYSSLIAACQHGDRWVQVCVLMHILKSQTKPLHYATPLHYTTPLHRHRSVTWHTFSKAKLNHYTTLHHYTKLNLYTGTGF